MKMKCVIIFTALFLCSEAGNLPSYVSQCCASDPGAEKCYLEQAKLAIPLMLSGDKYYNVVSLLPYREAETILLDNDYGRFYLYTTRLWGIDSIEVMHVKPNFAKGFGTCQYQFLRLKLQFTYDINILTTPLVGCGRGYIILDDVLVTHSTRFVLDKEGYIHFTDATASLTASHISYNLENLSEEGKEYLQDNFDQLHELFEPKMRKFFSAVLTSPLRAYSELIKFQCAIGFGRDCKKC